MIQWWSGLFLAAMVSLVALRLGWLTLGGALVACLVGGFAFGRFGLIGAGALLTFFVTSTLLGRSRGKVSEGPRTAMQVFANGGVASYFALYGSVEGWVGFVCALAAANADTWATEIGLRFGGNPRNIVTWRRVDAGASGGVTLIGFVGAAAGSMLMALWAPEVMRVVLLAGFLGALFDSLLGAALQARFVCGECGAALEGSRHCGQDARCVRGWSLLDNDGVNFAMTLFAALGGIFLFTR
jgi:uncharacterized protein (TIGR00297 family)